ncbi:MAG: 50S ribosomal protein L9 [Anaerolineae bacterium]|nr:50S ribosomal protein L9 [Anaerolineae bacterium]MDQ7035395.1 50S ribosomal protein L9 [Anaerolineae bacterium]
MKVILLQYVYKTGVAGEVVNVADGYARNFLIPRGIAKAATKGALKSHQKLTAQVDARRNALDNQLNEIAHRINGVELIFERRASPTGTLYGSVTTQEVADALLAKTGDDINRRRISQQALRELGEFEVTVRLGNEISPTLSVIIVREGETEEYLRLREAAAEGETVDIVDMEVVEGLPEIEAEADSEVPETEEEVSAEEEAATPATEEEPAAESE